MLSISLLVPVFGAIRLARYNAASGEETFFRGLPIPANGLFWASLGLLLEFPKYKELFELIFSSKNLIFFGLILSGLMVAPLPMFSLKFKNLQFKKNWYRYLFLIPAVLFFIFFGFYGLTFVILLYIFLNLLFYLLGIKY
jgi:CDP-diacylglycerol--serine O-phosphatidyltransferase